MNLRCSYCGLDLPRWCFVTYNAVRLPVDQYTSEHRVHYDFACAMQNGFPRDVVLTKKAEFGVIIPGTLENGASVLDLCERMLEREPGEIADELGVSGASIVKARHAMDCHPFRSMVSRVRKLFPREEDDE